MSVPVEVEALRVAVDVAARAEAAKLAAARRAVERSGWSLRELAEVAGVSHTTIKQWSTR